MAFQIDPNTMAISMHRGDTGAFWVTLTKSGGEPFDTGDKAIFTIRHGDDLIEREFELGGVENNGRFLIAFRNSDTDTWTAGSYPTEIRVVLSPVYAHKLIMTVNSESFTASVVESICLEQFDNDSGTFILSYDGSEWDADPEDYGIGIEGTPDEGDTIVLQYDKTATEGQIVDGSTVRTITKSKSTLTILDVQKEI